MSKLEEHARLEMIRAGFYDSNSDYGTTVTDNVMALIKVFADARHSGGSAFVTRQLFELLSNFKVLSPITDDPNEWARIPTDFSSKPMWQNKRQSSCMSFDGGKTHDDVDDNIGIRNSDPYVVRSHK